LSIAQHLERVPPQNMEAEQGVLGSMLLDRDAIAIVVEGLRPEDFYRDAHRVIFEAMLELFERGEPVDLITVTNRLAGMGKLDDIGGSAYLASLPNVVPTAANADFYAGIVLEKSMLRSLIRAGTHIAALGYEGADDVASLIDEAEKQVFGIAARRNIQDFQAIKEILKESFDKIDRRYQEKGTVTGVATGFTDLDMLTSGLQPSDMIIVAARPSVGKCLSRDAEILLEDGSITTIEEIARRGVGRLMTLGPGLTFHFTEPSAFVDDGIKPVFRVTTRLGRTVECTAVHPFLTADGWLPLAALHAGRRIAVPRRLDVFGTRTLPPWEITLLAYFIGDGGLSEDAATFASSDPHIARDFEAAINALGPGRGDRSAVAPLLMRHGLWAKRAERRRIPAAVLTLPREQLGLFINRLFATGGWVYAGAETRVAEIGYAAAGEHLARQVQHVLLRFGILASLRRRTVSYAGTRRTRWSIEITDAASILTFAREVGIFGKESQIRRALAAAEAATGRSAGETGPSGGWRVIAQADAGASPAWPARRAGPSGWSITRRARRGRLRERLRAIALALRDQGRGRRVGSDVYWDEIVAIEPVGPKQVYDLTIPGTHNFVANDICVHNTTFCTNIAQHASLTHKIPVAIFSLETSKEQLVQRILCSEAQVDNTKLRTGFLADEDWRKLARAMGALSEAPIFIDDSATLSVLEMRAKSRKLKAEHGLGLIVIDYIQMIQSYKRSENRTQELSEIARGIKSLAKELDVPIIAISQLSRAVESLGQKRPMLSHLRESGELEQVSDVVMLLYREDYYDMEKAQKDNKENVCEINIAKHRNGPIGTIELYFHKEHSRFDNLEKRR
jgi:replicative DNA helicase